MSKEERVAGILVIAVDCSTTAVKALILDEDGVIVASAAEALALSSPRPGWYEQDAMEWLRGTEAAIGAAVAQPSKNKGIEYHTSAGEFRLCRPRWHAAEASYLMDGWASRCRDRVTWVRSGAQTLGKATRRHASAV